MKKAIITGLICATLFTANSFAEFKDIEKDDWYYSAVNYVKECNIFSGTNENMFEPKGNMTRAMLVQVIYNMDGKPYSEKVIMEDIEEGKWYETAVSWALANNIASGIGENKFAPDKLISKEELIIVLYNYAKYKGYDVTVGEDTNILSYEDAFTLPEYAYTPMQWACGAGIIVGNNDKLNHSNPVTRAEVACIVKNFSTAYIKKKISLELEGNPTTGYVWEANDYNKNIIFVDDYTYHPYSGDLIGGAGIFEFNVIALNPGSTSIVFNYKRPFEDTIVNSVICQVDVKEDKEILVSQKMPESVTTTSVKTHSFYEKLIEDDVRIIETKEAFDSYIADYGNDEELLVSIGNMYNEDYFNTNKLAVIVRTENGGSIKNQVGEVTRADENTLSINISRILPQATTLDMVTWHIYIDLPLDNYSTINNIFTNINSVQEQ